MPEYKTPGVYIEEIPKLPPSIASVETAIPAFIGYTEKARHREDDDLNMTPHRITSMLEYVQFFGDPFPETGLKVVVDGLNNTVNAKIENRSNYLMYYSLQLYFANGGGPCWIVSVDTYANSGNTISYSTLENGLQQVEKINEVTLLLFPDSMNLGLADEYYNLHKAALDQAKELKDRFVVMDVWMNPDSTTLASANIDAVRNADFGNIETMKYGAVYYPRLYTILDYYYAENYAQVAVEGSADGANMEEVKANNDALFFQCKAALERLELVLPASCGVVGKYADTDNTRGVWKAPANIGVDLAVRPEVLVTHKEQMGLNVDSQYGKSINVIRTFPGKGPAIIWGARTLAGNDNEWRYISVRRFFNMVEESTKNATEQFVFEPNDENTWVRVKSMIQNYLTQQWKAGALMGSTTDQAFYVHVGLGQTMSELDIWEGRMIVEIGMAVVRPAEFIILRFMHKMLQES